LIDWLIDWLVDWLIDWLMYWLIDWLIDCKQTQITLIRHAPSYKQIVVSIRYISDNCWNSGWRETTTATINQSINQSKFFCIVHFWLPLQYSLTFICQFLWIVHFWLPLQNSLTFICQFLWIVHFCLPLQYKLTNKR
jgi:hypothetical protein